MKFDWLLTRGLELGETRIVPSLDANNRPLSHHDRIETCITALAHPVRP